MDTINNTPRTSRMMFRSKAALLACVVAGVVIAAVTFTPNSQPWGYIASPALSNSNFSKNTSVAYAPWFEERTHKGDLIAYPVGTDGSVNLLIPEWKAADRLDNQNWSTGRTIFTADESGKGIPFRWTDLSDDQATAVGSEDILNYVRGNRSLEGTTMRERNGVLGSIIHTTPVYVGKPVAGYLFDDYLEFAELNSGRAAAVYVGANDGMLHAFDAATGDENFAYVPSMVLPSLSELTVDPYDFTYFVDGFLTIEDAIINGDWQTTLVGGLGAGGKGYYALNVTTAIPGTEEQTATDRLLWEFHPGVDNAANVGYSYGRPSITRIEKDDKWVAFLSNGYMSTNGVASLFVVDMKDGKIIRELVTSDSDNNGLSSPTVVDTDEDGYVDTVYAGDLNGNVWKFDISDKNPDNWAVGLSGWPLFTTTAGQPITTAPEVGRHPTGEGVMVYVGTGRLFDDDDGSDKTAQAVYGLWDKGSSVSLASLLRQQMTDTNHANGGAVRLASDNTPNWNSGGNGGWVMPLETAGATPFDKGERVLQDMFLRDDRLYVMSINPTAGTGDNWFLQLDAGAGGAPGKVIMDINEDQLLDKYDNVNLNDEVEISHADYEDESLDRVIGQYQDFGLASRPVVGALTTTKDSALINHLHAINPFEPQDSTIPPEDPPVPVGETGLVGGHFDLDTSSEIYSFNGGQTDGHVHEWDDKHDLTTIDFMSLPDGGGDPLHEINDGVGGFGDNDIFILTIANTELSSGGVLEINGSSMSVTDYHKLVNKQLRSNAAGHALPRYKLNAPSAAEAAAGVQQLKSLKMSFSAWTLVNGGLIPTETGCVKGNEPGTNGEYRNGALMIQALDASNISGGFTRTGDWFEAGSTSVHGTLGYAGKGLHWETTIFWHWDGDCYNEGSWEEDYKACFITNAVDCVGVSEDASAKAKKTKKSKDKKCKKDCDDTTATTADEDDSDPSDSTDPGDSTTTTTTTGSTDPGQNVSNTTVGGSNNIGRLFWKELIPEE